MSLYNKSSSLIYIEVFWSLSTEVFRDTSRCFFYSLYFGKLEILNEWVINKLLINLKSEDGKIKKEDFTSWRTYLIFDNILY